MLRPALRLFLSTLAPQPGVWKTISSVASLTSLSEENEQELEATST